MSPAPTPPTYPYVSAHIPQQMMVGRIARMVSTHYHRWFGGMLVIIATTCVGQDLDASYERYREAAALESNFSLSGLQAEFNSSPDPAIRRLGLLCQAAAKYRATDRFGVIKLLDTLAVNTPPEDRFLLATTAKLRSLTATDLGHFELALSFADQGLMYCNPTELPKEYIDLLVVKAEALVESERFVEAQTLLHSAYDQAQKIEYGKGRSMVFLNLGNIAYYQGRYEEARDRYARAMGEALSTQHAVHSNATNNYLSCLIQLQEHGKALRMLDSIQNTTPEPLPEIRAGLLNKKGYLLTAIGNAPSAIPVLREAAEILSYSEDKIEYIKNQQHLANAYWRTEQSEGALDILQHALRLAIEHRKPSIQREILAKLSNWSEALGMHSEALGYNRRYTALNDSISQARFKAQLALTETHFRVTEKDQLIDEQEQALELSAAEARRRSLQRNALLGVAALLLLLALLLYRAMRTRQRLAQKEKELHSEQVDQLLAQQELKSINAMLEGQEKERERVAKDLHDRIGSMLGSIKHQIGSLESEVADVKAGQLAQYKKVNSLLDDTAGELRRISHDMAAATLSRFGLEKALKDLRDTLHISGRLSVELSSFGLDQRMERSVELAVYRIIQELVSNVLKHAQARELSISVTRTPGRLSVVVADDGRGFDVSAIHDGMGLTNVRSRAAALGATVQVDSAPGKGTTVSLECPVVE